MHKVVDNKSIAAVAGAKDARYVEGGRVQKIEQPKDPQALLIELTEAIKEAGLANKARVATILAELAKSQEQMKALVESLASKKKRRYNMKFVRGEPTAKNPDGPIIDVTVDEEEL